MKRLATLTEFLANMTEGVAAIVSLVTNVGQVFMEPPWVIIPIAGVTSLGYKIGLRILHKIKSSA